jgi:hypothetical protein
MASLRSQFIETIIRWMGRRPSIYSYSGGNFLKNIGSHWGKVLVWISYAPKAAIHENAGMDEEQTQVAVNFVEELLDLGAVRTPTEGRAILTTAPLFVVPKEGQEGEWRVIADMLRGGQNECIAGDPVFLPRISHILDQMYTGGYSAVVDAS